MTEGSDLRRNAYAVIIGINKYHDQTISPLQFACADAEAVYQILIDPELGRIPSENVIRLLDEKATQRNIRSAIGTQIPRRAGEQDMVYIYYAGHGAPIMDPKSRSSDGVEKYLVPVDAELDDLYATGISMDEIQRFFGRIQSKQVLFFIDSCYSGRAGGRTFPHPHYQSRHLLTGEFLEELAGEGRLVVTACDVNEVSLEMPELGHGLFTHYLIEGLKGNADKDQDGLVTIHELYEYVHAKVSHHARSLGGSMRPILKGSIQGKIFLTQYETAAQKQAKPLHAQARSYYEAGKLDEAYELWQRILKLVPRHDGAKRGVAEIENRRQEEQRKQQEILERKQRVLLNLNRDGELPSEEFDLAMVLIEKSPHHLTATEREIRRLLDELTNGKISIASYLKSLRLLRQPIAVEEKKPPPKPEPKIEKVKAAPPRIKPVDAPATEREKGFPVQDTRKRNLTVSAALILISLVIVVVFLSRKKPIIEEPGNVLATKETQPVRHPVITVLFAAAPGAVRSGTVVLSIASGTGLSTGSTVLGFGLSVPRSSFLLSEFLFSVHLAT